MVQALNAEPVQSSFKKQMINAVPDASIDAAATWSKDEAAHWKRITETVTDRTAGVIVIPGARDSA